MKHKGFTLIELSIVLVIIGLIIGGVLMGRDLIDAAMRRALISEREKILTGVNTFRLKYNGLPGDITNATSFWGTDPNGCPNTAYNTVLKTETCNGNGNGVIEGYWRTGSNCTLSGNAIYEKHRFWQQLANAGFIDGQYTGASGSSGIFHNMIAINAPKSRAGVDIGISHDGQWDCTYSATAYYPATYYLLFYIGRSQAGGVTNLPFITPIGALDIDTKVDDGKPATGNIMVHAPNWANAVNCASDSTVNATYLSTQTGKNCTLLYNERL